MTSLPLLDNRSFTHTNLISLISLLSNFVSCCQNRSRGEGTWDKVFLMQGPRLSFKQDFLHLFDFARAGYKAVLEKRPKKETMFSESKTIMQQPSTFGKSFPLPKCSDFSLSISVTSAGISSSKQALIDVQMKWETPQLSQRKSWGTQTP